MLRWHVPIDSDAMVDHSTCSFRECVDFHSTFDQIHCLSRPQQSTHETTEERVTRDVFTGDALGESFKCSIAFLTRFDEFAQGRREELGYVFGRALKLSVDRVRAGQRGAMRMSFNQRDGLREKADGCMSRWDRRMSTWGRNLDANV